MKISNHIEFQINLIYDEMKNIIVNADDFGYSKDVNCAVVECFRMRYITQTTIMVNMQGFNDAVQLAQKNNFLNSVGLHLNITEGYPLTEKIRKNRKFCSEDGQFNRKVQFGINKFILNKYDKECLSEEIIAQLNKYISAGFTMMHLDSHHHIHTCFSIARVLFPIAKSKGIRSVRLSRNIYTTKCGIVKRFYKYIYNVWALSKFQSSHFFGSYSDYNNNRGKQSVEIMVHPSFIDGKLVDLVNNKDEIRKDFQSYKY